MGCAFSGHGAAARLRHTHAIMIASAPGFLASRCEVHDGAVGSTGPLLAAFLAYAAARDLGLDRDLDTRAAMASARGVLASVVRELYPGVDVRFRTSIVVGVRLAAAPAMRRYK